MNKQLLIGLTGGIGAGKSTVAKIFKALGVPVFNSDLEAKNIVNTNANNEIKSVFGEEVYVDGVLDSTKMAELVFNDKEALNKLNAIIHPKVKVAFSDWIQKQEGYQLLIKEAAILIETNNYQELDKTILVVAPEEVKIKRVIHRDNTDTTAVVNRMKTQLSDAHKQKVVDFVIHNDDDQLLIPQVLTIHQQLTELLIQ